MTDQERKNNLYHYPYALTFDEEPILAELIKLRRLLFDFRLLEHNKDGDIHIPFTYWTGMSFNPILSGSGIDAFWFSDPDQLKKFLTIHRMLRL